MCNDADYSDQRYKTIIKIRSIVRQKDADHLTDTDQSRDARSDANHSDIERANTNRFTDHAVYSLLSQA